MKEFENYAQLEEYNPKIAQELREYHREKWWEDHKLRLHDNLESFAAWEVEKGNYAEYFVESFSGLPNLYDYISYRALGYALITVMPNYYHLMENERVVEAVDGWYMGF